MFANYSYGHDDFNGKLATNRTLPRSDPGHNHLAGDFSDLLLLPNPAQYQIYDPLTTRPDPARPGHVIRDPFPNNIIPADRITNPLYKTLHGIPAGPNTNPTASNQQPINNYYDTGQPDPLRSHVFGVRLDYNHSDRNRFFGRVSGSNFTEGAGDWTYESAPGLHALSRVRKTRAVTGTWTRVSGDTVIDGQLSANRFLETDQRLGLKEFTPSGIGLPAYMDQFCQSRGEFGGVIPCQLPRVNFGGANLDGNFYQVLGDNSGTFDQGTHYQGQLNLSQVRGSHTLRAGVDIRRHERFRNFPGNASGNFTFDNTYTAQSRRHNRSACRQSRPGLGGVHARHSHARGSRDDSELCHFESLGWQLLPGCLARVGKHHAELRSAARIRDGPDGAERPDAHRLRSKCRREDRAIGGGGLCAESDTPSLHRAPSTCRAEPSTPAIQVSLATAGADNRCGCRAYQAPGR